MRVIDITVSSSPYCTREPKAIVNQAATVWNADVSPVRVQPRCRRCEIPHEVEHEAHSRDLPTPVNGPGLPRVGPN